MARCVALLRGLNVGSHNRVAMTDLCALVEDLGFGNVSTVRQAGNVLLDRRGAEPETVEREIGRGIAERFSMLVAVTVRTAEELAAVKAADPFREMVDDASRYLVHFLARFPAPDEVRSFHALGPAPFPPDEIELIGRELYQWAPTGVIDSALPASFCERQLGSSCTARNWKTVTLLAAAVFE